MFGERTAHGLVWGAAVGLAAVGLPPCPALALGARLRPRPRPRLRLLLVFGEDIAMIVEGLEGGGD